MSKYKVGQLVRLSTWRSNPSKPIYLITQTDYVHPDLALYAPSTIQYKRVEDTTVAITRVFNSTGTPAKSYPVMYVSDKEIIPAMTRLENEIDRAKELIESHTNFLNALKKFEYDQELHLLQGGHGDHRIRRNSIQARKRASAGAGV